MSTEHPAAHAVGEDDPIALADELTAGLTDLQSNLTGLADRLDADALKVATDEQTIADLRAENELLRAQLPPVPGPDTAWRVGRHVPENVYADGRIAGQMQSAALAAYVVAAFQPAAELSASRPAEPDPVGRLVFGDRTIVLRMPDTSPSFPEHPSRTVRQWWGWADEADRTAQGKGHLRLEFPDGAVVEGDGRFRPSRGGCLKVFISDAPAEELPVVDTAPDMTRTLMIDPDCRAGKCGSCVGGPCEHGCHMMTTDAPEDDSAHRALVTGVLGAIAENQAVIEAELHDAHAVGDEPDQSDLAEITESWFRIASTIRDDEPEAARIFAECANTIRLAIDGFRLVPNIAIVLERPDAERESAVDVDGDQVRFHLLGCNHCGESSITRRSPAEARRFAACIALAADEAERSQG